MFNKHKIFKKCRNTKLFTVREINKSGECTSNIRKKVKEVNSIVN